MSSYTQLPQSLAEEIDQTFLNCGICLERFSDPRALPCLHAFCCECLAKLCKGPEKNLFCPTCRQRTTIPIEGVKGFAPHFLVTYLKDTVDKHIEPVGRLVMPSQKFCNNHVGELIRYFCETCKMTICPDCVILESSHKGHKYIRLKELAKKQANSLQELVELCQDVQSKYENCIEKTEQVEKDLEMSLQRALERLDKIRKTYLKHLDFILMGYKQRLGKQEASRAIVVGQIKIELQTTLAKIQSACELAVKIAETGTEFQTISIYASLSDTLQQLCLSYPRSADRVFGDIKITGAEEDVSATMALVAKDNCCLGDVPIGPQNTNKLKSKVMRGEYTQTKENLHITFQFQMLLKYILVALFAILMYRMMCSHIK